MAIILLACGPCVVIVNCWDRFYTLGRAPRTNETLPDFREWCRVTRHPRVFHRLTSCQRTPGIGASHLMFGEERRRKGWRNIGLNGNLLLHFFFHFQPRVMDFLSLIFFQVLLGWLCIFIFYFYFYSIILVIWGTATICNDEISRILFFPKKKLEFSKIL